MNIVGEEIKRIIESLGLIYFRSVNINDLNEQVGNVEITPGAGVYANLPSIENETQEKAPNILMQYSIEVYFLKLNFATDDKGEQVDILLDETRQYAQDFFDVIKKWDQLQGGVEDYTLDAVETLKLTKEVLTGWRLEMVLPIPRTNFYCPPLPPPIEETYFVSSIDDSGFYKYRSVPLVAFDWLQVGMVINVRTIRGLEELDGLQTVTILNSGTGNVETNRPHGGVDSIGGNIFSTND